MLCFFMKFSQSLSNHFNRTKRACIKSCPGVIFAKKRTKVHSGSMLLAMQIMNSHPSSGMNGMNDQVPPGLRASYPDPQEGSFVGASQGVLSTSAVMPPSPGSTSGADYVAPVVPPAMLAAPTLYLPQPQQLPARYRDFSRMPMEAIEAAQDGQEKKSSNNDGKEPPFPMKLFKILENEAYSDIITWLPHGRSWRVLKPKAFEEKVIPKYFRHTKYASFMRQVNGWGFKRMTQGPDHNSYYHEMFLRGLPQVCAKMRRATKTKIVVLDTGNHPDFYKLSMFAPLPGQGEDGASRGVVNTMNNQEVTGKGPSLDETMLRQGASVPTNVLPIPRPLPPSGPMMKKSTSSTNSDDLEQNGLTPRFNEPGLLRKEMGSGTGTLSPGLGPQLLTPQTESSYMLPQPRGLPPKAVGMIGRHPGLASMPLGAGGGDPVLATQAAAQLQYEQQLMAGQGMPMALPPTNPAVMAQLQNQQALLASQIHQQVQMMQPSRQAGRTLRPTSLESGTPPMPLASGSRNSPSRSSSENEEEHDEEEHEDDDEDEQ